LGVKNNKTQDPLAVLFFPAKNNPKRIAQHRHTKKIFSNNGYATSRLEVSFYGQELFKLSLYK